MTGSSLAQVYHALEQPCGDAFRAFLADITSGFDGLGLDGSTMHHTGDRAAGAALHLHHLH